MDESTRLGEMSSHRKEVWDSYWGSRKQETRAEFACRRTVEVTVDLLSIHCSPSVPMRILDLGCGTGEISSSLVTALEAKGWTVTLVGLDLSFLALNSWPYRVVASRVQGDAIRLPFRDNTFDGVVSFGYSSVASYLEPRIQLEITRTLREDGWLCSDFRNHLSLWFILFRPNWVLRWLSRYTARGDKPQHYLGRIGLRGYYAALHLKLLDVRFLLAAPPLRRISPVHLVMIDRWMARMRLSQLLGRIFVALFRVDSR